MGLKISRYAPVIIFISGKPASLFDDWLPTQNLGHPINVPQVSEERYERSKARRERRSVILATSQEEEPEEMDSEELDSENGPKGVERGVLQGTLPVDFMSRRCGEDSPLIDRIARVCCTLCNMCDSVVTFD